MPYAEDVHHLDYAERVLIQTQLTLGVRPTAIADGYRALQAHRRSRQLKATPAGRAQAPARQSALDRLL